ncbi:MAG: T9SS type A sorting domain-containing protein [Flavobacteriales bacterium]|nr:T9SS type A sorting domain-containing protein [Flavobacteriales bacterium]
MKKLVIIAWFFTLATTVFGQARVVINNNGFVVIDNSAFVVLANPNANALSTMGTGGNIVSEAETDVIQWEIGTTTGTYVIPWTTASGTKIPLTIAKTSAGTGATAEFILSTWETATDFNTPIPSAVNNMNYNGVDRSLFTADRFWHIDALSYAAKPNVTLTISYDPAANEIGGSNTITETNLLAQRFNTGLNHWESYNLYGTNDAANDRVTNIAITAADFFEDWILVDQTNPLPVKLLDFSADCQQNEVTISWSTATEINNNYFVVEKSYDAINFFELETVQGAGNSSVQQFYSVKDPNPLNGVTYYRLKQVDFDQATTYFNVVATKCSSGGFEVDQILFTENALSFNVINSAEEYITAYLYDYRGRIVSSETIASVDGQVAVSMDDLNLSSGIYMLSLVGEYHTFSTKLFKR